MSEIQAFDLRAPGILADPYPLFARLRADDPVHWSAALKGWVLTRYDDVKTCMTDKRFSADRISPFRDALPEAERASISDLVRDLGHWMVFTDPPLHTRLRGLANQAFTSSSIERMTPDIEQLVDRLIDGFIERGETDLIRDFAFPLPVMVIAEMLGVTLHDITEFKRWSDDLAAFVGSAQMTPDKRQRAQAAVEALEALFGELMADRRSAPREDMISRLIAASDEDGGLSDEQLVATCVLLLFAGHETTMNLIGNGFLALARNPGELTKVANEKGLVISAVEEALRYEGPGLALTRVALESIEMHSKVLQPGDRIFAMVAAANRDPAEFADPERLDVTGQPNRHLTFGHGIHFCMGAPLARLEGRIAYAALAGRLAQLELLDPDPEWIDSLSLRGVRSLKLGFTPAPVSGAPVRGVA
ncbi:MAG: cytochrome P450 [Alphaproteobacteria bacterium]|nr:cytochrome P450 [Alphaproteobacteria bacterium]